MTHTQSKITHLEVLAFLNMLFNSDNNITNGLESTYDQGFGQTFNQLPLEDRLNELKASSEKAFISAGSWEGAEPHESSTVYLHYPADDMVIEYRMSLGEKQEGTAVREKLFCEVAVEQLHLDGSVKRTENDRPSEPSLFMLNGMTRALEQDQLLNRRFLSSVINTTTDVLNFLHKHAPLKVLLNLEWKYGLESHSMDALVGGKKWLRLDISTNEGVSVQIVHAAGSSDAIYAIGKTVAGDMGPVYQIKLISTREEAAKALEIIAGAYDELKAIAP